MVCVLLGLVSLQVVFKLGIFELSRFYFVLQEELENNKHLIQLKNINKMLFILFNPFKKKNWGRI